MIDRLPILALLALASLPAASRSAARTGQRNYSVTSFDRIRIDGPYQVELRDQCRALCAGQRVARFPRRRFDQGRRPHPGHPAGSGGWGGYPGEGRGPVTIEVGTHDLGTAWINGAGALASTGSRGLSFDLSIQGSGIAPHREVEVDQMKVGVSGAGTIRLAGRVGKLTTTVRGTSSFDADGLEVKDAVIGAEGPSTVRTRSPTAPRSMPPASPRSR